MSLDNATHKNADVPRDAIVAAFAKPLLPSKSNKYYILCVWPLVSSMQNACALLSFVAFPAVQYFSTLSHKRHDFRKRLLYIKCVF